MPNPNQSPIYPGAVRTQMGITSAANTNRDGTGTMVDVFVAGAQGSVVTSVTVANNTAQGTASTAGVARLWRKVSGTYYLLSEVALPSVTPNTSVIGTLATFPLTNIELASGDTLSVSTSVADKTTYNMQGGDY